MIGTIMRWLAGAYGGGRSSSICREIRDCVKAVGDLALAGGILVRVPQVAGYLAEASEQLFPDSPCTKTPITSLPEKNE
jgi:hypothetical protein